MGLGRSRLPFVTLFFGLCGAIGGLTCRCGPTASRIRSSSAASRYFNWQPYVPVTFELGVLLAAISTVVGMLAFNELPMHFHPLFGSRAFEKVTDDGFFISIESWDPKFDVTADRAVPVEHRRQARGAGEPHAPGGGIVTQASAAERSPSRTGRSLASLVWVGAVLGAIGLVASLATSTGAPISTSRGSSPTSIS